MGMDLVAQNGTGLHFNWSGWSTFANLLHDLGADLSSMSGSNDGEWIDADVTISWADAIEDGLNCGKIWRKRIADSRYHGGWRHEYAINDGSLIGTAVLTGAIYQRTVDRTEVDQVAEALGYDIVPLDDDETNYLRHVSTFLRESGGCGQY